LRQNLETGFNCYATGFFQFLIPQIQHFFYQANSPDLFNFGLEAKSGWTLNFNWVLCLLQIKR
jgi:hypothetical protein